MNIKSNYMMIWYIFMIIQQNEIKDYGKIAEEENVRKKSLEAHNIDLELALNYQKDINKKINLEINGLNENLKETKMKNDKQHNLFLTV